MTIASQPESFEDFLEHFGIKGMKWGVRNDKPPSAGAIRRSQLKGIVDQDSITVKTKTGASLTLAKDPPHIFNKLMATMSAKSVERYNEAAFLTLKDENGKKVGDAAFWKKNDEELYLNWIGVKQSARGNGYASASLKAVEEFGAQNGFKKMTLEVPGNSPDARHIYESMGFKMVKEDINPRDTVWGGLSTMEYTFADKKAGVKHSGVSSPVEFFKPILGIIDRILEEDARAVDDFVKHFFNQTTPEGR